MFGQINKKTKLQQFCSITLLAFVLSSPVNAQNNPDKVPSQVQNTDEKSAAKTQVEAEKTAPQNKAPVQFNDFEDKGIEKGPKSSTTEVNMPVTPQDSEQKPIENKGSVHTDSKVDAPIKPTKSENKVPLPKNDNEDEAPLQRQEPEYKRPTKVQDDSEDRECPRHVWNQLTEIEGKVSFLERGITQVINMPCEFSGVIVGNEEVVDVVPLTDRKISITGKEEGTSSIVIFQNKFKKKLIHIAVSVVQGGTHTVTIRQMGKGQTGSAVYPCSPTTGACASLPTKSQDWHTPLSLVPGVGLIPTVGQTTAPLGASSGNNGPSAMGAPPSR